jgi:hypothetical protein
LTYARDAWRKQVKYDCNIHPGSTQEEIDEYHKARQDGWEKVEKPFLDHGSWKARDVYTDAEPHVLSANSTTMNFRKLMNFSIDAAFP